MSNEILDARAVVKWFNPFKGYGFVNVSEIDEDIFLHFSVLHQHEMNVVNQGDILICDITFSQEKGYHITCIRRHEAAEAHLTNAENRTATVKWYNPFKGYGFALDAQGHEILIHSSVLKDAGLKELASGIALQLMTVKTHKGYEAKAILGFAH